MSLQERSLAALLLLAVAVSFFHNLHILPLFDVDEGAFSQATREMFLRGDFWSTWLNGEPRYDKPILIYWLQALSVSVFGFTEFGFRLPSALAATLWVLATVWFTRQVLDTRRALLAGIMLAASLEIAIMAKAATADALLNLLIALTLFHLYRFLSGHGKRYLYWSALCAGLGFLAKGPVAVAIPAAVSLLYCLSRREFKAWLQLLASPGAWLIFLAVALPWYGIQYGREGTDFLREFLFTHNLGRFNQAMETHGGPWWYYLPVVLAGVLPYTTLLIKTLTRVTSLWHDPWSRWLLLWFGVVLVLFSLSATKLPHYVVYGYTGLFVLMAPQLEQLKSRLWAYLPQTVFFTLLLALPWAVQYHAPRVADPFLHEMLADAHLYFTPLYHVSIAVALLLSLALMGLKRIPLTYGLTVSGIVLCLSVSALVLPVVAKVQQLPIKEAALLAKNHPGPVVMWRLHMPSFSVYSGKIVEKREPRAGDWVATKTKHLADLADYQLLYRKQGIALVVVR